MLQLMRSSDGGFTHAYDEGEVAKLIKLGWVRADPSEQQKKVVVETIAVASVEEAEEVAAPRRGRPPKDR